LETVLEKIAKGISEYSFQAFMWSIGTQLVFLFFLIIFNDKLLLFSNEVLLKLGKVAIIAVVILIVSIPEGLPVAVSIAMAMSTNSLKKDKILIKKLESVQKCAMLHDVCVGKTGTLTESKITVKSYQITNDKRAIENDTEMYPEFFNKQLEIQGDLKDIIKESIISNTDVRIETDNKECRYVPKGQAIEVGLI